MKKADKHTITLGLVFGFFFIIGILIPYTGDDWNNLLSHNGNLAVMIKLAINNFNTFEGRFFSRIFDFIFNYYRIVWVFVNALGMTFLYHFMCKMVSSKKSFIAILIIESLLLVDKETFSQIYVWITGNITYFFPFLFLLFLIYINRDLFENSEDNKLSIKIKFLLPILGFIFSMFVENVSVGIITTCLLIIVYRYLKEKKIDYFMIVTVLTSLISLIIMLNSPGTKSRIDDMGDFSNLDLISKLLITIPRQLNYVFIKNSFLVFLLIFVIDYYIIKNLKDLKKYLLLVFMNLIPIITLIQNQYYNIFGHGIKYLELFLDCSNIFVFLYWLLFMIIYIYLIFKFNKYNNKKIIFFFSIAFINHVAMLISPLAGGRTSFLPTIMLYICVIILLDGLPISLLDNKKFINFNLICCVMLSMIFITYYSYCHMLDKKRQNYINDQLALGKDEIELIMLPEFYLWNANPWDEYHLYTFKMYNGIPEDAQTRLVKYSFRD